MSESSLMTGIGNKVLQAKLRRANSVRSNFSALPAGAPLPPAGGLRLNHIGHGCPWIVRHAVDGFEVGMCAKRNASTELAQDVNTTATFE